MLLAESVNRLSLLKWHHQQVTWRVFYCTQQRIPGFLFFLSSTCLTFARQTCAALQRFNLKNIEVFVSLSNHFPQLFQYTTIPPRHWHGTFSYLQRFVEMHVSQEIFPSITANSTFPLRHLHEPCGVAILKALILIWAVQVFSYLFGWRQSRSHIAGSTVYHCGGTLLWQCVYIKVTKWDSPLIWCFVPVLSCFQKCP